MWLLYTAIAMVFYFIGDYYGMVYSLPEGKPYHMWLASAAYMGTVMLWFPTLSNYNNICVVGMIWTALYTIIGLFVGIVCFKLSLTGSQIVGIIITLIGVAILLK